MKEIIREKIPNIHVNPGDGLELWYNDTKVLDCKIDREMTLDEAVAFYVEKGDFKDAVDGIGGAFLVSRSFKCA